MLYAPDTFVWRHHRALSFVLPRLHSLPVSRLYILGFQNNDVKEKMGKGMPPVGFEGVAWAVKKLSPLAYNALKRNKIFSLVTIS